MENTAVSDKLIEIARSMVARDKDKFSLAALCRESGVSRTAMRRVFPNKASLMEALLNTVLAEPKAPPSHQPVMEPVMTFVDDDWVKRQFRVFERAIEFLEVRVETVSSESTRAIAELDDKFNRRLNENAGLPLVAAEPPPVGAAEPPPLVEALPQHAMDAASATAAPEGGDTPVAPEAFDSIAQASAALYPPLSQNPTRQEMQDLLDNARRMAGNMPSSELPRWGREQTRMTLVAAGVFVALVVIATVVLFENPARATQTPATERTSSAISVIDATGVPVPANDLPPVSLRGVTEQAEKGDTRAQVALALAYLRGDGVKEDPVLAVRWSQSAAERGEPTAQYILGTVYANGVHPDPVRAFRWYSAAAAQGHAKAMHNLAIAFLDGSGVRKDPAAAASWFTKAAQQGYRDSAFDLAVLYERGEGVAQNRQSALWWYDKAASSGDIEAARRATLLRSDQSLVAQR